MRQHVPVLLQEAVDGLKLREGDTLLDCTYGAGGHTRYALEKHPKIKVIALDQDKESLGNVEDDRITPLNYNFRDLDKALASQGIDSVQGILFDLGTSVDQLMSSGRGFSFQKDEELGMNLDPNGKLTAKDILNSWSEETLETIFRGYGEERFSRSIAKKIAEERPIETTFQLVEIIKKATPSFYHNRKIHPATKVFQALRMATNDEFNTLRIGLRKGYEALEMKGRMAVISFHSIEDREVKRYFHELEKEGLGKRITKKPIRPTDEERHENPRSRSAKLRIFKKK